MEEIRAGLRGYPGVQIVVDKNQDGPPTGKPINIEITGEEIDVLSEISAGLIKFINEQNIPGIEELKKDVKFSKPELIINVDREAARRFGLSTYSISDAIRTSVFGKEVSKFKTNDEDYPIQLRAKDVSRNNVTEILNQAITFRNPAKVFCKIAMQPNLISFFSITTTIQTMFNGFSAYCYVYNIFSFTRNY